MSVNVKVAVPVATPVTTPALLTVATALSLLVHVPPVVGDNVVVRPAQIVVAPVILATGFAFTATVVLADVAEVQPNVVTATVYVPFVETVIDCVVAPVDHKFPDADEEVSITDPPAQKVIGPPAEMVGVGGIGFIVTAAVGNETQPVLVRVNVNVAVPFETPVTTPPGVTVATELSLLVHVPPVVGDNVVVRPAQIVVAPVILTTGFAFTVTVFTTEVTGQPGEFASVTV